MTEAADPPQPDSPPTDSPPTDFPPTDYASAMRELEGIVAELEREAVDVDHLSNRVRRAAELVELLRTRIADTRMEVARVITDLDPGAGAGTDSDQTEPH